MSKKTEQQRSYKESHPWARQYYTSQSRAKRLGGPHELKIVDFKELWFRDRAYEMKRPSIDRIDGTKGYIHGNCRYMELSENVGRDKVGKFGSLNPHAKPIFQKTLTGETVKRWESRMDAARDGGFNPKCITKACLGYQNTHAGFIWEYDSTPDLLEAKEIQK